jgi:hypothetical protein
VVEVNKVYAFNNQGTFDITNNFTQSEYDLVWKLFATCHTTIKSRDTFLGD